MAATPTEQVRVREDPSRLRGEVILTDLGEYTTNINLNFGIMNPTLSINYLFFFLKEWFGISYRK